MTFGTVTRRTPVMAMVAALALVGLSADMAAAQTDPDLVVTLELPDGYIDYEVQPGPLNFFDEENQPLAVQVIDGCAVNDHYWLFGAGLSGVSLQLNVLDRNTGKTARPLLPPFEPGKPIGTVFDPEALPICGADVQVGGLPQLDAQVTYTSADEDTPDISTSLRLLSDGADRTYRRLQQGGDSYTILTRGSPVAAVDEQADLDRIFLFVEGRVPRSVQGVVFSGPEGMLPVRADLAKALTSLPKARVRRAAELAQNGRRPNALIDSLGLRKVERVHNVDLDFETLGADAYLAIAGWIREGRKPIEPPALVDQRFIVELVHVDGTREELPLTGPFVGSPEAGSSWEYGTTDARVQVRDECRLSGTFWDWAAARVTEPVELAITDTQTGTTTSQLLWTDLHDLSRVSSSSTIDSCP